MKKESQLSKSFKIPYQKCKIHGQKLNYICFDSKCNENSLICSICKDEKEHSRHVFWSLKFYLKKLHEKYQNEENESNLTPLLDELELSQFIFYQELKKAVQEVALQFQKFEESVMQLISKFRNQITEEIAKRKRFNDFYQNLKNGSINESNFKMQKYIPKNSIGKIVNLQTVSNLSLDIRTQIQEARQILITREELFESKKKVFVPLDLLYIVKTPPNILFDGFILRQISIEEEAKSLCLIDIPVTQLTGKIGFKMVQLKKNASVIITVMPKNVYYAMNSMWEISMFGADCIGLGNKQFNQGWKKCEIQEFHQSSNLELSYKGGELKIVHQNKTCSKKLSTNTDFYIVISIQGEAQVRLTHFK